LSVMSDESGSQILPAELAPVAWWDAEGPDETRKGQTVGVALTVYADGTGYIGATREPQDVWIGLELTREQLAALRAALLAQFEGGA